MMLKDKVALVTGTSPNIGGGVSRPWRQPAPPWSPWTRSRRTRRIARATSTAPADGHRLVAFRSRLPMKQLPVPSDYGPAAVFLASDGAAMITGTDLRVDAGATARYWAWDPSK